MNSHIAFGRRRREFLGAFGGTGCADDMKTASGQFQSRGQADSAGGSGDDYAFHGCPSWIWRIGFAPGHAAAGISGTLNDHRAIMTNMRARPRM
ncbi:hypothetical protein ABZY36_36835 [Streptomyces sp. NPDC006627]|uniref:hypothetical protein n=1 Tax=Streptomyces sp. NPDC006627 TaxID=3154679 RepID=UPI0033BD2584